MTVTPADLVNPAVAEEADALAARFSEARPFRHLVIDQFLQDEAARELAEAFPAFDEKLAMNENGFVGAKAVNEKVRGLGEPWRRLDELVSGEAFRALISRLTGVPELKYDPHYFGGGTHENLHGQGLDAHVDFNFHPITRQHRRLNLILYLTEEWRDEWGGSIQLHRDPYLPPSEDEIAVVTPLFNRLVIFETNEHSWHGFPRIELPEDKRHLSRKSFALYYYTDSRPAAELGPEHSTIYVEQHLPEELAPGVPLSPEQLQHIRNLVASRDQHLRRLYGNIKQLYTELNELKERHGLQVPPGIDEALMPAPVVERASSDDGGQGSDAPAADETSDHEALERLTMQLARREASLRLLEQRVRDFENSTSWRITRPMRRFKRLLSGG
jgi:hypothetical protein